MHFPTTEVPWVSSLNNRTKHARVKRAVGDYPKVYNTTSPTSLQTEKEQVCREQIHALV